MKLILLFIIISLCRDKCRAITVEGGGTKGAYEAGVISGLANLLPPEERQWNVVSGVSVGSLTAANMALYPVGEEIQAAKFIQEMWLTIKMSDIIQNWPLSVIDGIIKKSGLFDSSPEKELLVKIVGEKQFQRHLTIGMTDAQYGGSFMVSNSDFSNAKDMINYLMASSAIPAIFPHKKNRRKCLC